VRKLALQLAQDGQPAHTRVEDTDWAWVTHPQPILTMPNSIGPEPRAHHNQAAN